MCHFRQKKAAVGQVPSLDSGPAGPGSHLHGDAHLSPAGPKNKTFGPWLMSFTLS